MNVFGIGLPEMAVIGAIALLVFGPKRLPEFGRTLGKTLKGFQAASKEFEREIHKTMAEPESIEPELMEEEKREPLTQSSSQVQSEHSQEVHSPPGS
ncbi:MAG: TatA/E family twin arginine-targeting protein translocase [Prochlorococcus sp.]|jgi:sec-independent protein translocase protein TatA|nr:TatA/E family twin arginine-targeting protein translocase [Prochlorococcaceae cyanobacterium ETNP18_MAG_14]MDP6310053.1 TatA/E family twin arginine-targeting protein translocase [Prochlorococcaceae cyanobacterium ETNP14_MAG_4]HJM80308.1 TatA/E family twin arginine-targeting protein translocase [Prochlorococcaceae cyanobacterium Fu_MAG_72]|tara:strand:- start:3942 stop:4232 length:291 start_codon:yes stop_codon:yes gene_type:complete